MDTQTQPRKVWEYGQGPEEWAGFIEAMHSGQRVEIGPELFDYFLNVLPPVYMGRTLQLDGQPVRVSFGFAEGAEEITAFWRGRGEEAGRLFCQRTAEINRRG